MDLISKKTRSSFQEYLVSTTLREISTYFDNHDVVQGAIPSEQMPSGQRRALVAEYYQSVDWSKPKDIQKILGVYADILNDISALTGDSFNGDFKKSSLDKLLRNLKSDGYNFENGKLLPFGQVVNFESLGDATSVLDKQHFQTYIERIRKSIDEDPELAIGSTKELLESTLKTILHEVGVTYGKDDDIPKLLKQVQKSLELVPEEVDDARKGADIIKVLLSNLGQVVIKVAELRNLYGSGHGKAKKSSGLSARHARLTVGAGITLATFLLETFELKHNQQS